MFNSWQAEATSEGSHEYYEDMLSMLKARKEMNSFDIGVTVGVYYVEVGLSGGEESEFLQNITKHNSQVWSTDPQVNMFYFVQHTRLFFCWELDKENDTLSCPSV